MTSLTTNTPISKKNKAIYIGWLALLLLVPIILWLLPADFFDAEDGLVVCPSRAFFDVECLGCGMTRAIMHLHHFQFADAAYYNYGSFVVYPAMIALWVFWTFKAWKKIV